jgi:hypothetical protein
MEEKGFANLLEKLIMVLDLLFVCNELLIDQSAQEFLELTAILTNRLFDLIEEKTTEIKSRFNRLKRVLIFNCFELVPKRGLPNEEDEDALLEFGISANMRELFAKKWYHFRTVTFTKTFPMNLTIDRTIEGNYNLFEIILIMFNEMEVKENFLAQCGRLTDYKTLLTGDGLRLSRHYKTATEQSRDAAARDLPTVFHIYMSLEKDTIVESNLRKLKMLMDMSRKLFLRAALRVYNDSKTYDLLADYFADFGRFYEEVICSMENYEDSTLRLFNGMKSTLCAGFTGLFCYVNLLEKKRHVIPEGKHHRTMFDPVYRMKSYIAVFVCYAIKCYDLPLTTTVNNYFFQAASLLRYHLCIAGSMEIVHDFVNVIERLCECKEKSDFFRKLNARDRYLLRKYKGITKHNQENPQRDQLFDEGIETSAYSIIEEKYEKYIADITFMEATELEKWLCSDFDGVEKETINEETKKEFNNFVTENASQSRESISLVEEFVGEVIPDIDLDLEVMLSHYLRV